MAASHERRQLTLREKIITFVFFLRAVTWTLLDYVLIRRWLYRKYKWSIARGLIVTLMRNTHELVTLPWILNVVPTTGATIQKICKAKNWTHVSHPLSSPKGPAATLHEIKLREAARDRPVILWFHGGGYVLPIGDNCPGMAHELGTKLGSPAVYLLEYALAPAASYPTQLRQAVLALQYLLTDCGIPPSQIVIGGDSAGGHMAVTLVAHAIQPHPQVPHLDQVQAEFNQLRGMCLVSPWVSMTAEADSFRRYRQIDMIRTVTVEDLAPKFKPRLDEVWANPIVAESAFWKKLPVDKVIVTAGGVESIKDTIVDFYAKLKASETNGTQCELVVAEAECHVHMGLDDIPHAPVSESRQRVLEWISEL